MNYHELNELFYQANDGFIFKDKLNHSTCTTVFKAFIKGYDCIPAPEPQPEPQPEPEPASLEERVQKLEEDKEPLEAQVTFTAVMTDTLLDEEEEE